MTRPTALLALLAGLLPASEVNRSDIGLWIETQPTTFDYTITSATGAERSGSDDFDRAMALRLGGRWTWSSPGRSWATLFGGDLVYQDADYAGIMQVTTQGLSLSGGVAWAPADAWAVDAELFAMTGRTSADSSEQVQVASYAVSGSTTSYGLRATVARQFARRWHVAASLGWMTDSSSLTGDTVDLTLERSGMTVGLGLIWRTNVRPAGLE